MSNPFQDLLAQDLSSEAFVRHALSLLEADFRALALYALADWQAVDIYLPELFQAIASLQRPSWGHWNGLLRALQKARKTVLHTHSAEEREKLQSAQILNQILTWLEEKPPRELVTGLRPLTASLNTKINNRHRLNKVLTLPLTLRNRVAHDAPTSLTWWAKTAAELRPLLEYHANERLLERLPPSPLPSPWFIPSPQTQTPDTSKAPVEADTSETKPAETRNAEPDTSETESSDASGTPSSNAPESDTSDTPPSSSAPADTEVSDASDTQSSDAPEADTSDTPEADTSGSAPVDVGTSDTAEAARTEENAAASGESTETQDATVSSDEQAAHQLRLNEAWTFNGIAPDFSVVYVSSAGTSHYTKETTQEVLLAFQRLLGKAGTYEGDFKKLLSKMVPEDLKGVLMGDYLLGKPIASGGFATVHVGRQLSTGRKIALKVLHDGMEDELRERFRQEARYLSQFQHPHIVQVIGYGEGTWSAPKQRALARSLAEEEWFQRFSKSAPVKHYIALEWLDGNDLEHLFQTLHGPDAPARSTPEKRALFRELTELFAQAANALKGVHALGLVHRDIKPQNIMLDGEGQLKLMDFGIARTHEEQRTQLTVFGDAIGTPAYMSPEQLRAKHDDTSVGPGSDIYSLCTTFYELFTGTRLYAHDSEALETVNTRKIRGELPQAPRLLTQGLPWELETILMGGLQPDIADRYPSAEMLEQDLLNVLEDKPITYRKPSLFRQLQLSYRRSRTTYQVVAFFLLLIASGIIGYLEQSQRYVQRLEQKQQALQRAIRRAERAKTEAQQYAIAEEQAKIRAQQAKIRAEQAKLRAQQAANSEKQAKLRAQQAANAEKQAKLRAQNAANAEKQAKLRAEQARLRAEQARLRAEQAKRDAQRAANAEKQAKLRAQQAASAEKQAKLSAQKAASAEKQAKLRATRAQKAAVKAKERAEYNLALGHVSQGALLRSRALIGSAREAYYKASNLFDQLGISRLPALIGLWDLESISNQPLLHYDGHRKRVSQAFFSPDGRYILSTSYDKTLKLWDARTGRNVHTFTGHKRGVKGASFSPDGQLAVSVSFDKTVKLWDIQTRRLVYTITQKVYAPTCVTISPDGRHILVGNNGQQAVLYDLHTARRIRVFRGHNSYLRSVAISPNSKVALTTGFSTIILWDLQTGKRIRTIKAHTPSVSQAVFSPDSRYILSGGGDSLVKLWSTQTGKRVRTFKGHWHSVYSVAISPNGNLALSTSYDKTVRLWNVHTGELLRIFRGHKSSVYHTTFSPDGHTAISTSFDKTIKLWPIEPTHSPTRYLRHFVFPKHIAISPHGHLALSSNRTTKILQLWDVHSGLPLSSWRADSSINDLTFSPDGKYAAIASQHHVQIRDLYHDKTSRTLKTPWGGAHHVAFSPDGNSLLTAGFDRVVRLWERHSGKLLHSFGRHRGVISCLAFSPNNDSFLVGDTKSTIYHWSIPEKRLLRVHKHRYGRIIQVVFSPSGERFLSASARFIKLWRVASPYPLNTIRPPRNTRSIAFSPDARFILAGTSGKNIKVWDSLNGTEVQSIQLPSFSGKLALASTGDTMVLALDNHIRFARLQHAAQRKRFYRQVKAQRSNLQRQRKLHKALHILGQWYAFNGLLHWALPMTQKARHHGALVPPLSQGILYWQQARYAQAKEAFLLAQREPGAPRALLSLYLRALTRQAKRPIQTLGHAHPITHLIASKDAKYAFSASQDHAVQLWSLQRKCMLASFYGHTAAVTALALFPDGNTLASASEDHTIRFWNIQAQLSTRLLLGHTAGVTALALSPDGKILASASHDKTIRLWNTRTGKTIHTLHGHTAAVTALALSPDGKTLLSASKDKTIRRWDLLSGKPTTAFAAHTDAITALAFSPDGKTFASASKDKTIRLWSTQHHRRLRTFRGHQHTIRRLLLLPGGTRLLSASQDHTIKLWSTQSNLPLRTYHGHRAAVTSLLLLPGGKTFLSASEDHTIKLWKLRSAPLHPKRQTITHTDKVTAFALSPDENTLASASGHILYLWNLNARVPSRPLLGHTDTIETVAFSPDGKTLASASHDHTVRLWNARDGKAIRTLKGHTDKATFVVFSPDGKTLASTSYDNTVKLWNPHTGKLLRTLRGHYNTIYTADFSPDGKTLVSGSRDATVRFWNPRTGKLLHTLRAHRNTVLHVRFSHRGHLLATSAHDRKIKLWYAKSRKYIRTLKGHTHGILFMRFSPQDHYLLSSSYDGTIRLWDRRTGTLLRVYQDGNTSMGLAISPKRKAFYSSNRQAIHTWSFDEERLLAQQKKQRNLFEHASFVYDVAISTKHQRVYTRTKRFVHTWSLQNGRPVSSIRIGKSKTVRSHFLPQVVLSRDQNTLMTADTRNITVWDLMGKRNTRFLFLPKHSRVAFCEEARIAASAKDKGKALKLWDLRTGKVIHTLKTQKPIRAMALSPDCQGLLTVDIKGAALLWSTHRAKPILSLPKFWSNYVYRVRFSPDGQLAYFVDSSTKQIISVDLRSPTKTRTFAGHTQYIYKILLTPDGNTLVSASRDGTIKLWSTASGKLLQTLRGHSSRVYGLALSPDGKTLVSSSKDKSVRLWDLHKEISRPKRRRTFLHAAALFALALDKTRNTFWAAGANHTIEQWDLHTHTLVRSLRGHTSSITALALSPDGKILISSSEKGAIKLWNAHTGKLRQTRNIHSKVTHLAIAPHGKTFLFARRRLVQLWPTHNTKRKKALRLWRLKHPVTALAFLPDGKHFLTASRDKTIKLWRLDSPQPLRSASKHKQPVRFLLPTPDGKRVFSASDDRTIELWRLATFKTLRTLRGHLDNVTHLLLTPDGKTLVSASYDKTIKLWNTRSGKPIHALYGHNNTVSQLALGLDGRTLLSASWDNTVKRWRLPRTQPKTPAPKPAPDPNRRTNISRLAGYMRYFRSSPKAALFLAARKRSFQLYSAKNGRMLHAFKPPKTRFYALAISPDGTRILSAHDAHTFHLWDARTTKRLGTFGKLGGYVNDFAFSPDGKRFLTATSDKKLLLWRTSPLEVVRAYALTRKPRRVAFTPDGKRALVQDYKNIHIWDLRTGKPICKSSYTYATYAPAFSPDGRFVLSAHRSRELKLWDTRHCATRRVLSGADTGIRTAIFSPDSKFVLTGHYDGSIRIWDVASSKVVRTLRFHSSLVYGLAFHPGGRTFYSLGLDNTLRTWAFSPATLRRTMRRQDRSLPHKDTVSSLALSPNAKLLITTTHTGDISAWLQKPVFHLRTRTHFDFHIQQLKYHMNTNDLFFSVSKKRKQYIVKKRLNQSKPTAKPWPGTIQDMLPISAQKLLIAQGTNIHLVQWPSMRKIRTFGGHRTTIFRFAYDPDSQQLASASHDKTIRLWNTQSGKLIHTLRGHLSSVHDVAFARGGKRLLSASRDKTIKLWNTRSGKLIRTLKGHKAAVRRLLLMPDGTHFLSASTDQSVIFWHLERTNPLHIDTSHQAPLTDLALLRDQRFLSIGDSHIVKIHPIPPSLHKATTRPTTKPATRPTTKPASKPTSRD